MKAVRTLVGRRSFVRGVILGMAVFLIAVLGMIALKQSTPYGLGLTNDSAAYVDGAENLLAGNGYSRTTGSGETLPITHFPPLFSILLASVGWIGTDLLFLARVLVILLFGATILLAGLVAFRMTGSILLSCLAAGLVAASDAMLSTFSFALSEPLFLSLMLLGVLTYAEYQRSHRRAWLVATSLVLGLATLTRFVGLALIVAAAVSLAALQTRARARRSELLTLLVVALAPIAAWSARNLAVAGTLSNRRWLWHPISIEKVQEGIPSLVRWAIRDPAWSAAPWQGWLGILAWAVVIAIVAWSITVGRRPQADRGRMAATHLLATIVPVYVVFLIVSISVFDASTPFDLRLLSPAILALTILPVASIAGMWNRRHLTARAFAVAISLALLGTALLDGRDTVQRLEIGGQGFASLGWRNSRAVQAVRELPQETLIYSDDPTGLQLIAGRPSYIAPTPVDSATLRPRPDYQSDLETMRERIAEGRAVLVLFSVSVDSGAAEDPWIREVTAGLPIFAEFNDATIYGKPTP